MGIKEIKERIGAAAQKSGRNPQAICLVAVSKGQNIEKIQQAVALGQIDFGENYAQELLEKAPLLNQSNIHWHFLGHLQKNKLGKVLPLIEWLHSLDSFELAQAIDKKATKPLKCLLEMILSSETTKSGLSVEQALEIIPKLKELSNIDLRGLMTMAPHPYFKKLFELLKTINQRYLYPKPLTELSMGMSDDFEGAIEEGATIVRVGTAIFGERK